MRRNRHIGQLTRAISGDPKLPWVILCLIATAFLVIIYPGLIVPENAYEPGDVAERNIKAPRDFLVEDTSATELNRLQAEEEVLTVYDLDPTLSGTISASVQTAFDEMRNAQAALHPSAPPFNPSHQPPSRNRPYRSPKRLTIILNPSSDSNWRK